MKMKNFEPAHFNWRVEDEVAVIALKRPEVWQIINAGLFSMRPE
ncbi:MAG TPA: hypothetical protein VEH78_01055 [Pseudolabrys sp.]|nr:hypothetical protein [Pseudolabrys sp.]